MRNGIEVRILGQVFTVVSDDGEDALFDVAWQIAPLPLGTLSFCKAIEPGITINSQNNIVQDKTLARRTELGKMWHRRCNAVRCGLVNLPFRSSFVPTGRTGA